MSSAKSVGIPLETPPKTFNLLTPVPFRSLGAKKFFKTWKPNYKPTGRESISNDTRKCEDTPDDQNKILAWNHNKVISTRSLDRNLVPKKTQLENLSEVPDLPRTKSIGAWFESVQNKPPPKKGGLVWARDSNSPFHERIQKTKSLYEEKMSRDKPTEASNQEKVVTLPPKPRIESSRHAYEPNLGSPGTGASKYAEFKARATTKAGPKIKQPMSGDESVSQQRIAVNKSSSKQLLQSGHQPMAAEKLVNGTQHGMTENQPHKAMSHRLSNGYINGATDTKSQSLPGFYNRRSHQQGLNDGFAANRISFFESNREAPPSVLPTANDVTMEATTDKRSSKKSFFRKIFSSKKSVTTVLSSSSASESDDLIQKRNWMGRRRHRKKISSSTSSISTQQTAPVATLGSLQTIPSNFLPQPKPSVNGLSSSHQTLGIPVWSAKEMSISYDSLPVSPRSYNSESAYGSINSVAPSQCAYSSTDTLTRREKKEAAMAKVERMRSSQKDSSSEDELPFRSASRYRKDKSSRTERYIRRKSHEMESLRKETEKDKRTKAIVEARIKEIQIVQLREAQRRLPQKDAEEEMKPRWSANLVYQESNEFDVVVLGRPVPDEKNQCPSPTEYNHRHNGNGGPTSSHTASYDAYVNKSSSLPPNSPPSTWRSPSRITKVSPTPPRRNSSKFLSPQPTPRPMSYSFEPALRTQALRSPRKEPSSVNEHNDILGYKSPYRSMNDRRASSEQRIFEPINLYKPNKPPRLGPEPWVSSAGYNKQRGTTMQIDCTSKDPVTTIVSTNLPPSPSSDYSSGVSENSLKSDRNKEEVNPFDKLNSVLQSEPYCLNPLKSGAKSSLNKIQADTKKSVHQNSGRADRFKMDSAPKQNGVSMRKAFVEKLEKDSLSVPQPPKRHSSNLTKDTRDMISSQLKMLIDQKTTSKKPSSKANNVDVEKAIEEMEEIYKHLNLNIEDILEGAERRDLPTAHQLLWNKNDTSGPVSPQRGRSIIPRTRKSITPDRVKDDLHFRRCQSTGPLNRKKRFEAISSYLLVSPAHGPPPEPKSSSELVTEPDVVSDDLCYRNLQKANSIKVMESQPPFGVPINPILHSNKSDYLHTKFKANSKPITGNRKVPEVGMDDMAFRNLRKENSFAKSVNMSGLDDALTELKTSEERRSRSSSVDRVVINRNNNQGKDDFWPSRQVRHLPKNRGKKKFIDRYKEALTDTENTVPDQTKNTHDVSDHGPVSLQDNPDIREAVITQSRNPCGGKPLEPFSITVNEAEFKTIHVKPAEKNPFLKENEQSQPSKECPKEPLLTTKNTQGNITECDSFQQVITETVIAGNTPMCHINKAEHVFLQDSSSLPSTNIEEFEPLHTSSPIPPSSENGATKPPPKPEDNKSSFKYLPNQSINKEINLLHSITQPIQFFDFSKKNIIFLEDSSIKCVQHFHKVPSITQYPRTTPDQIVKILGFIAYILLCLFKLSEFDVLTVFSFILAIASVFLTFGM